MEARRRTGTLVVLALLLSQLAVGLTPGAALAVPEEPTTATPGGATEGTVAALVRTGDGGLEVRHYTPATPATGATGATGATAAAATTTSADADADALVAELRARPEVVAADVDVATHLAAADPRRREQWALDTGRAEEVAALSTGRGVTVAVLDTGVEGRHPDLRHAVLAGTDVTGAGGDGQADPKGHGTHVAGIVAAGRGNGVGTAGLAPDVRVLPVRVLDANGAGKLSWAAQGIIWAVDHGADVITLSLGATSTTSVMTAAVDYAVDRGVVVVAASGNGGTTRSLHPAADPDVIAVGASTPADGVATFSNGDPDLDVVAPGTKILSTCTGGTWCVKQGTSMATPYVAATVATLLSLRPDLTPAGVRTLLRDTAVDLGAPGRDSSSGFGRVAPLAVLRAGTVVDPFLSVVTTLRRVGRAGDTTPRGVAVATSREVFPAGATTAVLGRDDVFADALTGAALAADSGPVLFTDGGPDAGLDPTTAAELTRVLAPGATVHVLGGPEAVSTRVTAEVRGLGFVVDRIAGATRTETAALVADRVVGATGARVPRVLVARADHWADAVTGSAYAAATGTPVLLTATGRLDGATRTWLAGHEVAEVVVLGGTSAVGDAVVAELRQLAGTVRRVGGADRAATAGLVASGLWRRSAAHADDAFVVVEGYGDRSWATAVAAAALSVRDGAPQLLVATDRVPSGTRDYLEQLGYGAARRARITAVGGHVGHGVGYALLPLIG